MSNSEVSPRPPKIYDDLEDDTEKLPRGCPMSNSCTQGIWSWSQVLEHCRSEHKDVAPYTRINPQGLIITAGQFSGEDLSWEEIEKIIVSPMFWEKPSYMTLGEK